MELTIRFEAHELPALLAQLLATVSNPEKLGQAVAAAVAQGTAEPAQSFTAPLVKADGSVSAPALLAAMDANSEPVAPTVQPVAVEGAEPKKRRGRKPKAPSVPPGPLVAAQPEMVIASAPAPIMAAPAAEVDALDPLAAPGDTPTPRVASAAASATPLASPAASASSGSITLNDLKLAYQDASMAATVAGADAKFDDALLGILARYGAKQLRALPLEAYADVKAQIDRLAKAFRGE